jgi:hypothetical protein
VAAAGGALVGSGCITVDPTLDADVEGSSVFEGVTVSEPWVNGLVEASVALTLEATRERAVRELAVTTGDGSAVWTGAVAPTQTSVSSVLFPPEGTATLAAADNAGRFVEAVRVRASGTRFP